MARYPEGLPRRALPRSVIWRILLSCVLDWHGKHHVASFAADLMSAFRKRIPMLSSCLRKSVQVTTRLLRDRMSTEGGAETTPGPFPSLTPLG